MDEYMGALVEHVRADTVLPIRYYYLRDDLAHYGFGCGEDALGCARQVDGRSIVGSTMLGLRHELVHASSVAHHRVLEEGLAVYLGTDLQWAGVADPGDLRAAFASVDGTTAWLPSEHYAVAGHFVSYLVDAHGLEATVELVGASEPGMTLDELDERAVGIVGRGLREEIAAYEVAGAGCEAAQYSPMWIECELGADAVPIYVCDAEEMPEPIEVSVTCEDGAEGVRDGKVWRDVLVDVPERVLTLVYLYEGHPVELTVRSCGAGCGASLARVESRSEEAGVVMGAFYLEAGLNVLRVAKSVETAGVVRISMGMGCF